VVTVVEETVELAREGLDLDLESTYVGGPIGVDLCVEATQ